MGILKRMMEEEQDRGFSAHEGVTICASCIDEAGIKQFIEAHCTLNECSYCNESGELVTACELDAVIEHIVISIGHEWGDPASEGLPYETREGGWQGTVYTNWELFDEIGLSESAERIYDDICYSIHDTGWCKRDPYGTTRDQQLITGWQRFAKFVQTKARYVFFKAEYDNYVEPYHEINPVDILVNLESIINRIGLVTKVNENTAIRRVRIVDTGDDLSTAKELGAPPAEFATIANRMSPAGISMFYGAFDLQTAIKETYEDVEENKKAVCGIFKPTRELALVDLAERLYMPSLFDEHHRHNRSYVSFLFDFVDDFTKPIERNDRAHIDYVPTQIVTEFLRHVFRTESNQRIDGVLYPSSKNNREKALVIFADSEQCVEQTDDCDGDALLALVRCESHIIEGKGNRDESGC